MVEKVRRRRWEAFSPCIEFTMEDSSFVKNILLSLSACVYVLIWNVYLCLPYQRVGCKELLGERWLTTCNDAIIVSLCQVKSKRSLLSVRLARRNHRGKPEKSPNSLLRAWELSSSRRKVEKTTNTWKLTLILCSTVSIWYRETYWVCIHTHTITLPSISVEENGDDSNNSYGRGWLCGESKWWWWWWWWF